MMPDWRDKLDAISTETAGPLDDESYEEFLNRLYEIKAEARRSLDQEFEAVSTASRIRWALATKHRRIQPNEPFYLTHMSHCYMHDWETGDLFSCKYGEDEICPAAMFEKPFEVYLELENKLPSR